MKVEVNYREYVYASCSNKFLCDSCAWKKLPIYYCVKFCRPGLIFKTTQIALSVFMYETMFK